MCQVAYITIDGVRNGATICITNYWRDEQNAVFDYIESVYGRNAVVSVNHLGYAVQVGGVRLTIDVER